MVRGEGRRDLGRHREEEGVAALDLGRCQQEEGWKAETGWGVGFARTARSGGGDGVRVRVWGGGLRV